MYLSKLNLVPVLQISRLPGKVWNLFCAEDKTGKYMKLFERCCMPMLATHSETGIVYAVIFAEHVVDSVYYIHAVTSKESRFRPRDFKKMFSDYIWLLFNAYKADKAVVMTKSRLIQKLCTEFNFKLEGVLRRESGGEDLNYYGVFQDEVNYYGK